MYRYILIGLIPLLSGCGTLREIIEKPEIYTEGVAETVGAVSVIGGGLGLPAAVLIGIGYVLHIARVIYKKKVGSRLE